MTEMNDPRARLQAQAIATRDAILAAASDTGFEYVDEPREGQVLEFTYTGDEPYVTVAVLIHPTFFGMTPKGYAVDDMATVRTCVTAFAKSLEEHDGRPARVHMPDTGLESHLDVIKDAAQRLGLELDTEHGSDGHFDAIGVKHPDDNGRGTRSLCLRFEDGTFTIHGWTYRKRQRKLWEKFASRFSAALGNRTGLSVDAE